MAYQYIFPDNVLQLREAINKHPVLVQLIQGAAAAGNIGGTLDVVMHAAAYVNIEVDGYFNEEEMLKLCDVIIERLKIKEIIHVQ